MDLSWPKGASINDGVEKNCYLNSHFVLKYPSVDTIVETVKNLGPACKIFKVDISRAFRHVPIDLGDVDLLGFNFNGLYLDKKLPFGFRMGSGFCS